MGCWVLSILTSKKNLLHHLQIFTGGAENTRGLQKRLC